jgi:hypothetical protein
MTTRTKCGLTDRVPDNENMKNQKPFQARDYRTDEDYNLVDSKFRAAANLEYAVLLAHVMVEDQLIALLAARLGADTMPDVHGFELIAALSLAGSRTKRLRDTAGLLNTARNEVGHKMHRNNFGRSIEHFVRTVKGEVGKAVTWPTDETERIAELRLVTRLFMVEIALATEYEEFVHREGEAAFEAKVAARM